MLTPYELILKKRNNQSHTKQEIQYIIDSYLSGIFTDYHMSAWLMSVNFNGLNNVETIYYTKSIINSGKKINWDHLNGFVVDKHSTGGVGDKVSISLAPILSACDCYVPMIVGRGLGHTGGTLDKLESLPNYNGMLEFDKFITTVEKIGCSIIGQIPEVCPADLKIYNLRDQTATIKSNPLICGSIMSKKIAEGIKGLIMDIKVGNGAFMKNINEAKSLSRILQNVALNNNIKVKTIFSNMNQILGNTAGLYCEVLESMEILKGGGPSDLNQLVKTIAEECLKLSGQSNGRSKIEEVISSGKAYEVFLKMITSHGVKVTKNFKKINQPKYFRKIISKKTGFLQSMDTFNLGMGLVKIGAGRTSISDRLDPTSGLYLNVKIGDSIAVGDEIGVIFNSDNQKLNNNLSLFEDCFNISHDLVTLPDIIIDCS